MRFLCAILCLSGPAFALGVEDLVFKQVAAPASDIVSGRVRLPDPSELATTSRALIAPIAFARASDGTWVFERTLVAGGEGVFALALMTPEAARFTIEARGTDGAYVPFENAFGVNGVEVRSQTLDADHPGWRVDRFDVRRVARGPIDLRLRSESGIALEGLIFSRDALDVALSAHVTTLATTSDREIGIVAHAFDSGLGDAKSVARGIVEACFVEVTTAGGRNRLEMFDDGRHGDGDAFDGVFGAFLPRWTSGDVTARVEAVGEKDGARFERGVQIAFPIVERRTALTGDVTTRIEDRFRLRIELGALPLSAPAQLHVSAEVWGIDEQGAFTPVCWLSRMVVPEARGGEWKLPLYLDGRWIDVTRTHAPFVLRHVRVQDPDSHVPYDEADWMPLFTPALPPIVGQGTTAVTSSMLAGSAASASTMLQGGLYSLRPKPFGRTLLLVHGYCSGGSIWPAADFTGPKQEFLDPNQNRTHDQFAQLLRAAVTPRSSFGVVGHSQGGPAALHLYTYYWSGLDNAVGPRLIQSVASPYQGTPLASLGSFACGVNNDMTPAGSTTWLAGIPTWARAQVYYWTTSDNGSACNFLTGLLLTNPEDGTVEQFRGQLPGANSMGHVAGWCHTTGMTYPANYTDHARNALMNTNAAR